MHARCAIGCCRACGEWLGVERMKKLDLKKELKHLYRPSAKKVEVVNVPQFNFVMIDGQFEPGETPLLEMLESDALNDRLAAIQALRDSGDKEALVALRKRLARVSKEMIALVAAVGKLKKQLGVK